MKELHGYICAHQGQWIPGSFALTPEASLRAFQAIARLRGGAWLQVQPNVVPVVLIEREECAGPE
jgi:hypothetical protein